MGVEQNKRTARELLEAPARADTALRS